MTDITTTTLPLPVKVVRAAATRVLRRHRERLDAALREQVKVLNVQISLENSGFLHRLLRRPVKPLLDVDATVKMWLRGEPCAVRPLAWWLLDRPKSAWWRRLEHLASLPAQDDDLVMTVSLVNLALIEYDAWRAEQ